MRIEQKCGKYTLLVSSGFEAGSEQKCGKYMIEVFVTRFKAMNKSMGKYTYFYCASTFVSAFEAGSEQKWLLTMSGPSIDN